MRDEDTVAGRRSHKMGVRGIGESEAFPRIYFLLETPSSSSPSRSTSRHTSAIWRTLALKVTRAAFGSSHSCLFLLVRSEV
jgi:hypothetical protein